MRPLVAPSPTPPSVRGAPFVLPPPALLHLTLCPPAPFTPLFNNSRAPLHLIPLLSPTPPAPLAPYSLPPCFSQMVFDEYRSMQGGLTSGEQYRWGKPTAMRAFQGLAMCGVAAYVSGGRQAGRGAAFAAAELRVGRQMVDGALKAKGTACPDLLLRFFRMEV